MVCAGRPRWQEEHNRPLFLISLPVCQTTSHRRCYNCRFWPLIPTRYAHLASIPSCLLPTITQLSGWHRITDGKIIEYVESVFSRESVTDLLYEAIKVA